MTKSPANLMLIDGASCNWRRRLGALPWAVFEELALVALPMQRGWTAPVGVRYVGAALGINKDTAARAISTLRSAGLVQPGMVDREDGPPRSGYLLTLPDGVTLGHGRLPDQGCASLEEEDIRSPEDVRLGTGEASPGPARPELLEGSRRPASRRPDGTSLQPALFTEEDLLMRPMRLNCEGVKR